MKSAIMLTVCILLSGSHAANFCDNAVFVIGDAFVDSMIGTETYSTCIHTATTTLDTDIRKAEFYDDILADAVYTAYETSIAHCASAAATWQTVASDAWREYRSDMCAEYRESNPHAVGA